MYLKDRNKTAVYLEFIYTLKIDQNLRQNSIRLHLGQMLAAMRFGAIHSRARSHAVGEMNGAGCLLGERK